MNWEAIGAVGEVLGALAVVVTLIYLALQIRQNSSLARVQLNNEGMIAFSQYRAHCNEYVEIVVKMQNEGELTAAESVIAHNIVADGIFACAVGYENSKISDKSRSVNFVLVAEAILTRHRWPLDRLAAMLDAAGYREFTSQVKSQVGNSSH